MSESYDALKQRRREIEQRQQTAEQTRHAALQRDLERLRLLAEDRRDAMVAVLRDLDALERRMRHTANLDADGGNHREATAVRGCADELAAVLRKHR